MFANGNVIKRNVLVLLLILVRMYSYSAFSNVIILVHHQCTRTHENVLGPRSDGNHAQCTFIYGTKHYTLITTSHNTRFIYYTNIKLAGILQFDVYII